MKCHWAKQAAVAVCVIILTAAMMAFFVRMEYKSLMVVSSVAGVMLFLVFTNFIGICANPNMHCNIAKLWGMGAAAVVVITSLINLLSSKEGQIPD